MSAESERHRIVAVETTGRQGSVALAVGDQILAVTHFATDLRHAVELLPAIDRLCGAEDWRPETIDEVYVSAGPGSFTGCRIGVTFARALALAIGAKLVGVPTMDVLALNALDLPQRPERLVVLLDAQRHQAYAGLFDLEGEAYRRRGGVRVGEPASVLADVPMPCAVLGEGVAYHRRALEESGLEILSENVWPARADKVLCVGRRLAAQGNYVAAADLVPIYIRLPEAEEKWQLRHNQGIC